MTADDIQPDICREFAPGVFWVGGCLVVRIVDPIIHSHFGAYLVQGSKRNVLVDTGHPQDWSRVKAHLHQLVGSDGLDYIFPTHQEYPHAGNLGSLLELYPRAKVIGDVRDYHAYFPEFTDAYVGAGVGDRIDLGDRDFVLLPALIRDLPSTLWGYDSGARVMFVSDGFAFSHQHLAGECDLLSGELGREPAKEEIAWVNERALHWTKFVDSEPIFEQIDELFDRYPVDFIAPAHGSVIDEPEKVVPRMRAMMADLHAAQGQ